MTNLIFIDMDGTLISFEEGGQYIPPSALKAIEEARKKGNLVYICTGRSLAEIQTVDVGKVDGFIGGAGAFVIHQGAYIYKSSFQKSEILELMDFCDRNAVVYYLESDLGLYYVPAFPERMKGVVDIFEDEGYKSILKPIQEADFSSVNKVCFYTGEKEVFEMFRKNYQDRFNITDVSFGDYDIIMGEVSQKGITKAYAMQQLLDYLALDEVKTYAIGDSLNDREILEASDVAIVMGNARENVKALADFVTESVMDDGIAVALKHFDLV